MIMVYRLRILFFVAAIALTASCSKLGEGDERTVDEIILGITRDSLITSFETKATAITTIPSSLYWGATTGSGTETAKWSSASATVSSSRISTGKYQTATPTTYNYYVSNVALSVGANTTVSASNTTDVICGRVSSNSATPTVTLGHIFARTGTLSFSASGYTVSNVTWKIVGKSTINGTAGTYNLRTGAWTAASAKLSTNTTISSSSNLYLIPGTYTVTISFTSTKGGVSKSYTKTGDVVLVQGKVNNITGTPNMINSSWDDDWDDGGETGLT